jgi:hypothetical protein
MSQPNLGSSLRDFLKGSGIAIAMAAGYLHSQASLAERRRPENRIRKSPRLKT